MAGTISLWLRLAYPPGDWHFLTDCPFGLFVNGALFCANEVTYISALDINLTQHNDDKDCLFLAQGLCGMPQMLQLDLARQTSARYKVQEMRQLVAITNSRNRQREGTRQANRQLA